MIIIIILFLKKILRFLLFTYSQTKITDSALKINNNKYKVYPVYYPVGNGIFNMDKAIEDIKWIIENEIENIKKV